VLGGKAIERIPVGGYTVRTVRAPPRTLHLRVELKGSWPPIWRRLQVPDRVSLPDLHLVIQGAFGWQGYHLHEFIINGLHYGDPDNDEWEEPGVQDESGVRLRSLGLREGDFLEYIYDFGDGWEHLVTVEKVLDSGRGARQPSCFGGKRACPPEDVGGLPGYREFLEAMSDPSHAEHDDYVAWIGGAFDPGAFDLAEANQRVRQGLLRKRASDWDLPGESETAAGAGTSPADPRASALLSAHELAARDLPLRRDVEAFLGYLRDHAVTGTASSGNLPLKAVAEFAALMTEPPRLEQTVGDIVIRFRSEDDVWPLHFIHILSSCAGLASGGPGRRWRLTHDGESFASRPAVEQLLALLDGWWYRANWLVATRFSVFGEELPPRAPRQLLALLRKTEVGRPAAFREFVDELVQTIGLSYPKGATRDAREFAASSVERSVIGPLEAFGIVTTRREKKAGGFPGFDLDTLSAFSLTPLGRALSDALREG
jgi:hypothetical protein